MDLENLGLFISIHYEIPHVLGQAPKGVRFDRQFCVFIKWEAIPTRSTDMEAISKTAYIGNRLNTSHS